MASDSVPECMATRLLKDVEKNDLTGLDVAYASSSPFGAGIETVYSEITQIIFGTLD